MPNLSYSCIHADARYQMDLGAWSSDMDERGQLFLLAERSSKTLLLRG